MGAKLVVFVSFLIIFQASFVENFPTEIITDLIKSYEQPTAVTAFLCKAHDSINLVKILSSNDVSVSVHHPLTEALSYPFPVNYAMFIVDLQCNESYGLLKKADLITQHFSTIHILVNSDVMIANSVDADFYNLKRIYKRGLDLQPILETVGFWKRGNGVIITERTKITARRRKDLMGTVLKACLVITHNDSLNHLTDKRDKHIDTIAKVNYVLVEHLGNIVNATLTYSIQSTWGYKDKNSQWNGMIGELQRYEADIGGTALFLTADRIPVIDYIAMTTPTRSKFVFRRPKLSYVANVYTLPFHWSVWISSVALIFITIILLYVVVKWEWKKKRFTVIANESNDSPLEDSWFDITMLALGAMCQQGASSLPFGIPGRIITILMFISLMFLYTSYAANIVALLQSSSNSIKTLGDLLHSRLDVGVDDTVFNRFYFPNATEPIRRAIYLEKVAPPKQNPKFYPIGEGVKKMREGHFAFHMETGAGYKIVQETFEEHEKCGLQEIQFLQVSDPWLAVQKNTSYREMLKIGLHQIRESGLQAREVSLLYTKKPACTNRGSSFVSVSIIDCYLADAVLFCGMILSVGIFILEFLISNRLKKYQDRQYFLGKPTFLK